MNMQFFVKRNATNIIILFVLLVGLGIAIYLSQQGQDVRSRASVEEVTILDNNGNALETTDLEGAPVPVTTNRNIQLRLDPPAE